MQRILLTILMVLGTAFALAQQEARSYLARRTGQKPRIDGKPFEKVWDSVIAGKDFVILRPDNGKPEPGNLNTEIKMLYDDDALYVAAYLYDADPDKISMQFSKRDETIIQSDLFSFWINTYNNQIEQTRFYVTAAGAMADSKAINGDEDFSYNVIFDAKTSINESGWFVEMVIPYQALRFARNDVQQWSFNALRRVNRLNLITTFNFVNIERGNQAQYDALLLGIENISPPLRLSLFPYASVQYQQLDKQSTTKVNAGMDFKVGLSDAFTLDATLIPDFGQVGFDEVELNLSPFEQVFEERRPFFTEGTELFSKGNIFFSRRIGQVPVRYSEAAGALLSNEVMISNPVQSQLLNAVKLSGRTRKKLGIGILNAVTASTKATILDTLTGIQRAFLTSPLVNYNVLVLDQQYGANSSFYFSNASTFRKGDFSEANVSSIGFSHFDKANRFNYAGEFNVSSRFLNSGIDFGYSARSRWEKVAQRWRYGISYHYVSASYNPNDLGLQFQNNFNATYLFGSFNQFTPKGWFNNYTVDFSIYHSRTNAPDVHNYTQIGFNPSFQTRGFWQGGFFVTGFTREFDFFESRIALKPVRYNPRIVYGVYLSSDRRKRFSLYVNVNSEKRLNDTEYRIDLRLRPSLRVNSKLFLQIESFLQMRDDRLSFVGIENGSSLLSYRDTRVVENTFGASYNFTTKTSVNLRLRNFWSAAIFSKDLRMLMTDGKTVSYAPIQHFSPNTDFNVWNLDCSFEWQFAPASSLIFLYRNALSNVITEDRFGFAQSVERLFELPLDHTISLRMVYFLDANRVFKLR